MLKSINNILWSLSTQGGIRPLLLLAMLRQIPRYIRDCHTFRKQYKGPLYYNPALHDRDASCGFIESEYFWQDLYVARKVFAARPKKHIDIGSRLDGFVAHVASFADIEVFDIRPCRCDVPGLHFRQIDVMDIGAEFEDCCDSLSCLHALEHFGLGRYGDPIRVDGHIAGMRNIVKLLRPGGCIYLSVPIGIERVEFNAHRVMNPYTVLSIATDCGLALTDFAYFRSTEGLVEVQHPQSVFPRLQAHPDALGIFSFRAVK